MRYSISAANNRNRAKKRVFFLAILLHMMQNWSEVGRVRVRSHIHRLLGLAIILALGGCGGGGGGADRRSDDSQYSPPSQRIYTLTEAQQPAQWTVLVYLDADNNLEPAAIVNFNQMEMVGSTKNVHVIVQMDRKTGDDINNDSWTDTRRYLITYDSDPLKMHSLRLDSPALGELDMGSPETLHSFVQWGMQNFPAEHYLLVIWDHGTGWMFRSSSSMPQYKYVAMDNTSGTSLNVTQIPTALSGLHPDVIAFDACYMQEIEVAYQLSGSTDYLVGSSAAVPSNGYNYARLLSHVANDCTPEQLSRIIVQQYALEYPSPTCNIVESAIDMSKIGALADAASEFGRALQQHSADNGLSLAQARADSLDYSTTGMAKYNVDILDYAGRCKSAIGSGVNTAYANLVSAYGAAVIASAHNSDTPTAHGLAIYVPSPTGYDTRYSQLAFAQTTWWDDWIKNQPQ